MKKIAVIGGGISGLAAAFALEQQRDRGAALEYAVFEASSRLGGVIRTEIVDDCLVEAGPDSFLTEKPSAANLCRELGLGDQLTGSNDSQRKTYIVINGRSVPIPDGLVLMAPTQLGSPMLSPLFSLTAKFHMLRERFYRPQLDESDTTVAKFVERHYGREMVDRLADPLLAGVYGGSADELSVQAVLPRFAEVERQYGSLGKGMLELRKHRTSSNAPLFTTLRGGMQQMVDALVSRISPRVARLETAVDTVTHTSSKWVVDCHGAREEFDAAIISTPAYAASKLLRSWSDLSDELAAIPYTSSAIVVLGYGRDVRAQLSKGFGFLVPKSENRRMIAATFVHNKFPYRVPEDRALIRCFFGSTRDVAVMRMPDAEIESLARRELAEILRLNAVPCFARVYKWRDAMAQYGLGHLARISRIRALLDRTPGLALAGNAYGGIGVPDCIRSGREAAKKILKDLAYGADAKS